MASSQLFNTFWHGGPLSWLHRCCLRSFVTGGHRIRLHAYRDVDVPAGVEVADARGVLPEADLFAFDGSFSAFSNVFRYALLLEQGGWWVDTDVYCATDAIPECRFAWAREAADFVNGAILRFPAGDPTMAAILRAAREVGRSVQVQGQLGPRLLTAHLADRVVPDHFGSTRAFYPVHWLEAHRFWLPGDRGFVLDRIAGAPFVHLWSTMLRYLGVDSRLAAPQGSFLQSLYERAGDGEPPPPLDPVQEQRMLASIRVFLGHAEMRARSASLLGYDVFARLPGEATVARD